jgi:NADH-quinone oxidoreductase subunit I
VKFSVRIYLFEILKGLKFTLGKLIYNLMHRDRMPTISYPEEKRPISVRLRSLHRLLKRPDDKPRCVACMLCATACPAECIHIEANEESDKSIEKYPAKFEIDLLRCVFCGFCVEACPCDAIRMDTGKYDITGFDRKSFVINREQLLGENAMPGVPEVAIPRTLPGVYDKQKTDAH